MWIWIGIGGAAAYLLTRSREKSWDWDGESRQARYCGKPVPHRVHETKTKNHIHLRVAVRIPTGIEFRIGRESMLSRLLRRAGIGREVQTGLAGFDDTYEVQSEDPRIGNWLRESAPARKVIGRLFGKSVSELIAHNGRMWVEMTLPRSETMKAYAATQIAAALIELRMTQPPARAARAVNAAAIWSRAWLPMMWTYGWAVAAAVTFFGVVFIQYPQPVDAFQWRLKVSGIALALSPMCIWLAARWLRDSIMARIVLAEFITVGTFSFALGAGYIAERGNIEMARAPIQTAQVEVRDYSKHRHTRSTTYFLHVEPFAPDATANAKFKVSGALYQAVQRNSAQKIALRWRVGAFGQPIVVEEPRLDPMPAAD